MAKITPIDLYIKIQSPRAKDSLLKLRDAIRKLAPNAEECINYGIPTIKWYGNLVHFAAFKNHIGFYPGANGIREFIDELSDYKYAKGSVQFPLGKPLPQALIKRIVKFRIKENEAKAFSPKNLRVCRNGHSYYKNAGSPSCPECEKQRKLFNEFLITLAVPARRALENKGIRDLKTLSSYSEKEISQLHGMGPSALSKLKKLLKSQKLSFAR